ncbi:MOSC domain-containing protein [Micromonospora sp. NPDC094482]|uniref:MOSC domain-containing protein n=1 Tax=unclassified Micromonospora TaxID=2617518 RepID=UPI00332C41DB
MIDMQKVVALLRYPLKSAQGETLKVAAVEHGGLRGDRAWACLDGRDGTVGSAKHPRRWGRLLDVGTSLRDDAGEPMLVLRVDGRNVLAGTPEADAVLSRYLGRVVHLSQDVPADAKLHRQLPDEAGMVPGWMEAVGAGQEIVTAIAGPRRVGRLVDFGAVHIVTTGALSMLGQQMGRVDVAAARFRPNLVIDAERDPEPGQELQLGDVVLRVIVPTPRCVVPGLSQGELPADRTILGALAQHHRISVLGLGRAACFGTYAEVVQPGQLRLEQRVR